MPVKLHTHQEEAVAKMHNGCILYGDVGVGKTITSLGYYFTRVCGAQIGSWGSMSTPKDVYVITTAKVRDTRSFELQAAAFGVHTDPDISTNGVKITVDSWNNITKYVGVKNAFFIFDEQRVVGYGSWSRSFIKIARDNEWILLSATPGDTWLDYIPVFIANGFYKNKTDFIDTHVIWTPRVKYPKVMRYQEVNRLVRQRNEVLVHMPYKRHTVRHSYDIYCDYDEVAFDKAVKKRWHVFENRPLRDAGELFSVIRRIVNSDVTRVQQVQELLKKHPKLIVFYNFDYELEMLRTLGQNVSLGTKPNGSTGNSEFSQDWSYLLSPEGLAANLSAISQIRSETPSQTTSLGRIEETTPPLSTTSSTTPGVMSSEECEGPECSGHWTEDDGTGEICLPCPSTTSESTTPSSSSRPTTSRRPNSTSTNSSGEQKFLPTQGPPIETQTLTQSDTPATATLEPSLANSAATTSTAPITIGEWNGHKHEPVPVGDRWLYLVQYTAGSEGWNCIETDAICFYSQTYSYRAFFQVHGRIDRLNTPFVNLHYYHLISRSAIDKAIRAALKVKKSFNERNLAL